MSPDPKKAMPSPFLSTPPHPTYRAYPPTHPPTHRSPTYWKKTCFHVLQADLQAEKARTEAGTADAPAEGAVSTALASRLEQTLAELDLNWKTLQESETRAGQLERSLVNVVSLAGLIY